MRTDQIALTGSLAVLRRKGKLALCLALSILALGVSASGQHPTIITFDPPGSGYTAPNAINRLIGRPLQLCVLGFGLLENGEERANELLHNWS